MSIDFDKDKISVPLKLVYAGVVAFAGWWVMQYFMPLVDRVTRAEQDIATLKAQREADRERMNRHEERDDAFLRGNRGN